MKILIVEDDFTSRLLMQKLLTPYGECHLATNGEEAVAAFTNSKIENSPPFDLICLDIMMPGMDGQTALSKIRQIENDLGIEPGKGAKIIMTTALKDKHNVMTAFYDYCDAYMVKPIEKAKLIKHLRDFGLIE